MENNQADRHNNFTLSQFKPYVNSLTTRRSYCHFDDCKSSTTHNPGIAIFSVPRKNPRRALWLSNMGLQLEDQRTDLKCCQEHFIASDFNNRGKLLKQAVPHKKQSKNVEHDLLLCTNFQENENSPMSSPMLSQTRTGTISCDSENGNLVPECRTSTPPLLEHMSSPSSTSQSRRCSPLTFGSPQRVLSPNHRRPNPQHLQTTQNSMSLENFRSLTPPHQYHLSQTGTPPRRQQIMASPVKKPRLEAAAASTPVHDNDVVILNKNRPVRMYSPLKRSYVMPKASTSTTSNNTPRPIIKPMIKPIAGPTTPVVAAAAATAPQVIRLDSSPEKSTTYSPPPPEKSKLAAALTSNQPPKMVIHVPKSLYKSYKEGKITLAELTEKAKKIQKLSPDQSWPSPLAKKTLKEVKQPVTIAPKPKLKPTFQRINANKSSKTPLQQVNEMLMQEPVDVTEPPPVLEPIIPPKDLHSVEKKLNTAEVVGQVHQVAPRLPIRASTGVFTSFLWSRLIPNKFRDWPVPASVLYAAAVQLKRNVNNRFSVKDKVEIETVLHLVGHYTSLGASSRCHVRERVHFYLKKLQSELTEPKSGSDAKQKNKGAEAAGGENQNQADGDALDFDGFFS